MKKISWKEIADEWCMTFSQIIDDEIKNCDEEKQERYDKMTDAITDLILYRASLDK
jgi:hypothetical protein